MRKSFNDVWLRGDTDFSLTGNSDRWTENRVSFVFGMDGMSNLVSLAEGLEETSWKPLVRRAKHACKGNRRERCANVKERIVQEKGTRTFA